MGPVICRWTAILAPINQPAPDGRIVAGGFALQFDAPVPVLPASGGNAPLTGSVETAQVEPGLIVATGTVTASPATIAAMADGRLRPQMELDTITATANGDGLTFSGGRLRAVAVGDNPAWTESRFTSVEQRQGDGSSGGSAS